MKYTFLRNRHKSKHCTLYPPYRIILEAKIDCYPEAIVPLQSVLDHTAIRLLLASITAINIINESNTDDDITLQWNGWQWLSWYIQHKV